MSPAPLGLVQSVIRKITSFEMVDADIIKEHIWRALNVKEEELPLNLQQCGYDSNNY
jgi:hypothetical protein